MRENKNIFAFTLLELLVVVAIIGVLSAIGVLGYNGYTNLVKERVCISNFNFLDKMIKETAARCEGNKTVKLKAQYWNSTEGIEYDFQCGYSLSTVANEVLKSFTNFVKDPYNPTKIGRAHV